VRGKLLGPLPSSLFKTNGRLWGLGDHWNPEATMRCVATWRKPQAQRMKGCRGACGGCASGNSARPRIFNPDHGAPVGARRETRKKGGWQPSGQRGCRRGRRALRRGALAIPGLGLARHVRGPMGSPHDTRGANLTPGIELRVSTRPRVQRLPPTSGAPLYSPDVSLASRARAVLGSRPMGAGQRGCRSTSFTRAFIRPRSSSGSLGSHRRPASM
jgi:hypothetical protein